MGIDFIGDYIKMRNITLIGLIAYPLLAPIILMYVIWFNLACWILKRRTRHKARHEVRTIGIVLPHRAEEIRRQMEDELKSRS